MRRSARSSPARLVAVLAPLKWAASQGRYALFSRPEMERVIVLSRRPSIPPGELLRVRGEAIRKGGSIDFAWYLWRVGKTKPAPVSGGSSENSSVREVGAPRKGSASPGRLRVSEKVYDYE